MKNFRRNSNIFFLLLGLIWISFPNSGYSQKKKKNKKNKKGDEIVSSPKDREKIDYFFIEAVTQNLQGNTKEAQKLFEQVLELDPKNHASNYNLGKLLFQEREFALAEKELKKAIKLDGDNFWYYGLLSDIYNSLHDSENGIATNIKLLEKFPDHEASWLNLSKLYMNQGKMEDAIRVLNEMEKYTGPNEEASTRKYKYYFMEEKDDEALIELDKLIEMNPYNTQAYRFKHDILLTLLGRYDEAVQVLQDLLKIDPNNGFALLSLADYYESQNDEKKSEEFLYRAFQNSEMDIRAQIGIMRKMLPEAQRNEESLQKLGKLSRILELKQPDNGEIIALRGHFFRINEQKDSAEVYYRNALDLDPTNELLWEEIILLSLEENDFEEVKTKSENALEYFPDQSLFLYFHGISSLELGENEKGIYSLERITKVEKLNQEILFQAHFDLAETFQKASKFPLSETHFEKALEINEDNPTLLNNYAYYLSLRNSRLTEAEQMVKKALEKQPETGAFQDTYGWILYLIGDYTEAKNWIKKALDNNGGADVMEHYGDVLFQLGEKLPALEYWKKAQEKGLNTPGLNQKISTGKINE